MGESHLTASNRFSPIGKSHLQVASANLPMEEGNEKGEENREQNRKTRTEEKRTVNKEKITISNGTAILLFACFRVFRGYLLHCALACSTAPSPLISVSQQKRRRIAPPHC
jgi:hypothetical protein